VPKERQKTELQSLRKIAGTEAQDFLLAAPARLEAVPCYEAAKPAAMDAWLLLQDTASAAIAL